MRRPIRRNPDRRGCGFSIASPRAYHHAEHLNISCPSGISFGPKPALLSLPHAQHRPAGLRRPLRRNPDTGGCGFSIASPQAYHHAERISILRLTGIECIARTWAAKIWYSTCCAVFGCMTEFYGGCITECYTCRVAVKLISDTLPTACLWNRYPMHESHFSVDQLGA